MDWPSIRVEDIPPEEFVPDHCPRHDCPSQQPGSRIPFSCTPLNQTYTRKCDGRVVPRFRCHACRRTFSQQSFAVSYYLKRPELLEPIAKGLVAGSAHRQLGRSLGCAHSTVTRQAAHLGRHAMLLTARMLSSLPPLEEAVCYDHFETFGVAQDFPLGVGTPFGARTWLMLGLDAAPHRRGGRMSAHQKTKRAEREAVQGRAPRGGYRRAFGHTLDRLTRCVAPGGDLELVTDDKPDYQHVVAAHTRAEHIRHARFANPPRGPKRAPRSSQARTRDSALRPVDTAHQFIRHTQAHHRRETIAFARRHSALLERIFLHGAWLNFVKRRVENLSDSQTRAVAAGVTEEVWDWNRVFARRLQPHQVDLPPDWVPIYFRRLPFPRLAERKPHVKKYAI
jgi:transposase-like protein